MSHTAFLLIAAGTLGAPPAETPCPCSTAAGYTDARYVQSASTGPIREWLRSLFGQPKPVTYTRYAPASTAVVSREPALGVRQVAYTATPCTTGCTTGCAPVNAQRAVYQPAPCATGRCVTSTAGQPVQQIAYTSRASEPPTVTTANNPPLGDLPVDKKYEDKVGHETNYSWVTGHLYYVHVDGGHWVVRYGLPGEIDKFGGSVVLAPGVEMRNYREGDLVCVFGDILDEGRPVRSLGGALYRVNVISVVDRSDP